jgi:hypothetical protein
MQLLLATVGVVEAPGGVCGGGGSLHGQDGGAVAARLEGPIVVGRS